VSEITRQCMRTGISGAIDRQPEAHTFFDQKVDWLTIDDPLPKMTSDDPLLIGYKEVGR
jgi:hypothetical protein